MERKELFDRAAVLYDEARPSYPESLIEDVIRITNISSNDKLLEVGAGTGKATVQFARRGFQVHCVELGENLAAVLKAKCSDYPGINVDVASFESWEPEAGKRFNLIYSAQAFHWIDPQIKYKKCHELLAPNGCLALFWYDDVEQESGAFPEIKALLDDYIPDFNEGINQAEKVEAQKQEIFSSGYFQDTRVSQYFWDYTVSSDDYIKIINSHSGFMALADATKAELEQEIRNIITSHGGYVASRLMFSLYAAKSI